MKLITALMGLAAFFLVLGWAGDRDYVEYCVLRMSYEEYDTIKAHLTLQNGYEPSERDIALWWASHNQ